ncbi:MAG TPA: hypothetical protein PK306_02630 [Aquabacterium sp.]|nr:hypothetical protein [Aquabacterium sp.]HQC94588.1 hypothetical protein [Aquabacterium sp.]
MNSTTLRLATPSATKPGGQDRASTASTAPAAVSGDLADLRRLDIKAVSALTGRCPSSLRQMVREGRFPPADYRDGPRCTRWNAGTVRQWLVATSKAGA